MKYVDLREMWQKEAKIDERKLDEESSEQACLHEKYFHLYLAERMALKKMKFELKQLESQKHQFFTEGPSKEQFDDGWKLPARGKIMKADVGRYLDADQDLIDFQLKIEFQQSKVDYLFEITQNISRRSYQVGNIIKFLQWSQEA